MPLNPSPDHSPYLEAFLHSIDRSLPFPDQIDTLSHSLLGRPYIVAPLIGSLTEPEQLVTRLDGFDCVTFVETVLAAVRACDVASFTDTLRALRYVDRQIDWRSRNHYSVDWLAANERNGFIRVITPREDALIIRRTLSLLEGYPAREHELAFLPVEKLADASAILHTGDLLYFGTTRDTLDVSHVGILIKSGPGIDGMTLRHATKAKGAVVDEPLADFLTRFGATPGLFLARPLPGSA